MLLSGGRRGESRLLAATEAVLARPDQRDRDGGGDSRERAFFDALPTDRSCQALAEQVRSLDAVLGADLDTPSTSTNPSLIERGAGAAKKGAIGAVRGAAEDVVPMRSWVRKLTGAEKYSREVQASITAGTIRRSYLKGLGQAAGCESPAAPLAPKAEE